MPVCAYYWISYYTTVVFVLDQTQQQVLPLMHSAPGLLITAILAIFTNFHIHYSANSTKYTFPYLYTKLFTVNYC